MYYNYELFRRFDFSMSVSLAHATRNYNRSKISLNLPHAHAREGFSWRVCDILASNVVLLSNRQPDLLQLCKGKVDLPTYESKAEARDIAKALLADPVWRSGAFARLPSLDRRKMPVRAEVRRISQVRFPACGSIPEKTEKYWFLMITSTESRFLLYVRPARNGISTEI